MSTPKRKKKSEKTIEKKPTRTTRMTNTPRQTNEPSTVPPLTLSDEDLYTRVALTAYHLYQQRGEEPGRDLEDWFTAERLVKAGLRHGPES